MRGAGSFPRRAFREHDVPDSFPLPLPDTPADMRAAPLLVGLSGGLDSTVLLHRLAHDATQRARGLRAIHVHHGLHADADAWAEQCTRLCASLGVPLEVAQVDVARDGGEGLEAAARHARNAAFESALRQDEILVLAHHQDDQAETFLLRALRASGVDGLAAMRPWRRYGRGWLWRPLLAMPRATLHAYAQAHALTWIEDPSNDDTAHDRNFLRHRVLPLLQSRWPQADAAFARAASLQSEAAALLSDEDHAALASVRTIDRQCLQVDALLALDGPRLARVLRLWLSTLGLPRLPAEGMARIERDLLGDARGAAPAFAWRDAVVRRWRDLLWAGTSLPALPGDFREHWNGNAPLALPDGGSLRLFRPAIAHDEAASPALPFVVHARVGGERIRLPGRHHDHALKHVLQDLGVPPWVRARLPLLSNAQGRLLAAGNLVFSADFDAWLRTGRRRLAWDAA